MASKPIEIPIEAHESVSNNSASSGFGSYDSSAALAYERTLKRKAMENVETVADLDQLMRDSLKFTPTPSNMKRHRYESSQISPVSSKVEPDFEDRPPTRRSISIERCISPTDPDSRIRSLRSSVSGTSLQSVRLYASHSTESVSPTICHQFRSPRKRINLNDNASSLYTRHRLGNTFSPLVTGSRKRASIFKRPDHQEKRFMSSPTAAKSPNFPDSILASPRKSGMRKFCGLRVRTPLINRLHEQSEEDKN